MQVRNIVFPSYEYNRYLPEMQLHAHPERRRNTPFLPQLCLPEMQSPLSPLYRQKNLQGAAI